MNLFRTTALVLALTTGLSSRSLFYRFVVSYDDRGVASTALKAPDTRTLLHHRVS